MAHAEARGKFWRARWIGADGTRESESGFTSKKAALKYAQKKEAEVAAGTAADERAGQIQLTDWVNKWFPAQDLELNTLNTYRGIIELMILPRFGHVPLGSVEAHDVAAWEKGLIGRGYKPRTAREARKLLSTIMGDAIPRYIKVNPAARKRGKGRKGQRRIEEAEKAEKVWPTPLQALLFAERCALLTGDDSDFVLNITAFYTGARWSEIMGLGPKSVSQALVNIHWKLYELNGRFYRGRPKDGSIRDADIPAFLADLLEWQIDTHPDRTCTCRNEDAPWCPGMEYVFLTSDNTHHRRSNYSSRIVRPAADARYPARESRYDRLSVPVLVDMSAGWPGVPLPPWPPAVAGQPYTPPTGRGIARLTAREGFGRCSACARSTQLRQDGTLINHGTGPDG